MKEILTYALGKGRSYHSSLETNESTSKYFDLMQQALEYVACLRIVDEENREQLFYREKIPLENVKVRDTSCSASAMLWMIRSTFVVKCDGVCEGLDYFLVGKVPGSHGTALSIKVLCQAFHVAIDRKCERITGKGIIKNFTTNHAVCNLITKQRFIKTA